MHEAVKRGLDAEGALPGPLGLSRKAVSYYVKSQGYSEALRYSGMLYSYALAVIEENACGGTIVTAPTCGSCGILPAMICPRSTKKPAKEDLRWSIKIKV